jgi:hypothetical protein
MPPYPSHPSYAQPSESTQGGGLAASRARLIMLNSRLENPNLTKEQRKNLEAQIKAIEIVIDKNVKNTFKKGV